MSPSAIEAIGTLATVLAVAGVVLNAHRRIGCFGLWAVSNSLTLGIHAWAGIWSMVVRDVIFLVLAWYGWRKWRQKLLGGDAGEG